MIIAPSQSSCNQRSAFTKYVKTRINWSYKLGIESDIDYPMYFFDRFQTNNDQTRNIDIFCRLSIARTQCGNETEKTSDGEKSKL